jgi:predicted DNA-binding transcriptional regulator YafY
LWNNDRMSTVKATHISDLETILIWEGEIDNPRIRELLGVRPVWASRLLAELQLKMGDRAVRATSHSPLKMRSEAMGQFTESAPDEYLRVLSRSSDPQTTVEDGRQDQSVVSPQIFSVVNRAIRNQVGVSIAYRSMANPQGKVRTIFPHSFVKVARRWHVRAWCTENREFRDFTLGRMRNVSIVDEVSENGRQDDADWNSIMTVEISAHPDLNLLQQKMIEDEYFLGAKTKALTMRRCLVGYTIQDLSIATDAKVQRPPEYQLCVVDAKKILPLF